MSAIAFDNDRYLAEQSEAILERMSQVGGKLYLEFGGKLMFDYHAARVLPGFDPNVKMRLLQQLASKTEIILCIYAGDIDRRKMRADFGITYDADTFKLIDDMRERGLEAKAVVIIRYEDQPAAEVFRNKLQRRGIRVYTHRPIPGYAQYRGPAKGLYMCGSSNHPGGGVMAAPGANAAREILHDLRKPNSVPEGWIDD